MKVQAMNQEKIFENHKRYTNGKDARENFKITTLGVSGHYTSVRTAKIKNSDNIKCQ